MIVMLFNVLKDFNVFLCTEIFSCVLCVKNVSYCHACQWMCLSGPEKTAYSAPVEDPH